MDKDRSPITFLKWICRYLILLLPLIISGCYSKSVKKDGPPNYYVDVSKIPNAKPKSEPLSRYGNMPVYSVFGKRYYPMKSSKHYDRVGTASWYGTQFHERRTSSGERYNMLAMTAAHKTLPLPTYVEVTNLRNQRKIIVKVNDRGPFESNRIIDLSYVAAKKLDIANRGTALVRVKAIDLHSYNQYPWLARSKQTSTYWSHHKKSWQPQKSIQYVYLHVGTFKNKLNAERLKQRLITLLTAPVRISYVATKNKLYRVHIGPIKNLAIAKKITNRLKHFGIIANKTYS